MTEPQEARTPKLRAQPIIVIVAPDATVPADSAEIIDRTGAKVVVAGDLTIWLRHIEHALAARWPAPVTKARPFKAEPPSAEELEAERRLMTDEEEQ